MSHSVQTKHELLSAPPFPQKSNTHTHIYMIIICQTLHTQKMNITHTNTQNKHKTAAKLFRKLSNQPAKKATKQRRQVILSLRSYGHHSRELSSAWSVPPPFPVA